ncbi:MAG: radical SAM protein [Bacteroidaceae bacterium]|nr:radical SAM protein [Bacteroidaceae bacterium]
MSLTYSSPIFGPVHSRRLGISLGINLLPSDGKMCSFDCIYCECGFNKDFRPHNPMPTREEVATALEAQLRKMQAEGPTPDVFTFAGNGEPTLHPHFPEIIDDTLALRDQYFPQAKVSVLTNATQILRPAVFEALRRVDNNICKLDTIQPNYIRLVDQPNTVYDVEAIIDRLIAFGQDCIIQTMFMQGQYQGHSVDNTTPEYVLPWLSALQLIQPREVMIYTLDRETPAHTSTLQKATHEQLDNIAAQVRGLSLPCSVAY